MEEDDASPPPASTNEGDASTSKSGTESEATLGEINFEELIKASNVTPQTAKENQSQIEEKSKAETKSIATATATTTATTIITSTSSTTSLAQKTSKLTKIAPKLGTGQVKTGSQGQVVIIQSPTGTPMPIRITGSNTNNTNDKPVTIQVLKMPDGRLIQIKNNKALNLTNLSNVTQMNIGAKKPAAAGSSNSTIIVKSSTSAISSSTQAKLQTTVANTIAGVVKTKTVESTGKQLQQILPAPPATSTTSSSSNATTTITSSSGAKQVTQKIILQDNKEIRIKGESETGLKQIIVPQHVLKLSPNSTGPIQAIQIPGKPGLQYVRVLGTTSGSSGSGARGGTLLTGIRPKDSNSSPSKMAVIPQVIGNQKIIMTTKPKKSLLADGGSAAKESLSSSSPKQNQKSLITTVPTLRKISDTSVSKVATAKEEEDPISIEPASKTKTPQPSQQVKKFGNTTTITSNGHNQSSKQTQRLMVPLELFRQMQSSEGQGGPKEQPSRMSSGENNSKKLYSVLKPSSDPYEEPIYPPRRRSPTPDGLPRRKHCNCTKSQCLKLYCDCFANGEFCQDCNCKECFNNLEFEDERQKAIKICLERNPNAFKPKITKARDQSDLRLHNKGCNCKRSGCLKNYCECYEAKIACSSNCKCFGCRNVEDRSELDPLEVAKIAQNFGRGAATKRHYDEIADKSATASSSSVQPPANKQPYNFITQDVVDATIQCMIAQADECKKSGINTKNTERMILEELGRCLVEIIDFSIRNMEN